MLSKTDFMLFLESPMHLWAKTHDQIELKLSSLHEQHLIQQGQKVEALAKEYIETFLMPLYEAPRLLWQPDYNDGKYEIRADALIWDKSSGVYDLYEIKSSTSIRRDHEYDVTFQVLLLEEILDLRRIYILHIDNNYQLGENLDLEQFFSLEEISTKVEKRREDVAVLRQKALDVTQMTTIVSPRST